MARPRKKNGAHAVTKKKEKEKEPVVVGGLGFKCGGLCSCGQGGHPVDVLVVKKEGRTTGEAYVVYATDVEVDMALAKNKGYMGRRYVEVFKAKKLVSLPPPHHRQKKHLS